MNLLQEIGAVSDKGKELRLPQRNIIHRHLFHSHCGMHRAHHHFIICFNIYFSPSEIYAPEFLSHLGHNVNQS